MRRINWHNVALLLAGFVLSGPSALCAEQVRLTSQHDDTKLTVTLSSDSVLIADPLQLELSVLVPEGKVVQFPELDSKLGALEVIDSESVLDIPVADGRLSKFRWTLESLQTGELFVPAITFKVSSKLQSTSAASSTTANPSSISIETKPIRLIVRSMIEAQADPTKFRDIHSVVDVDVPSTRQPLAKVWIALGVASIIGLLALAVFIARRRPRYDHARWAVKQFSALRGELETGQIDQAIAMERAHLILRDFLSLQFDRFNAAQTTEELLVGVTALSQQAPDRTNEIVPVLSKLFTTADAMKYAGLTVDTRNILALLDDASGVVEVLKKWRVDVSKSTGKGS